MELNDFELAKPEKSYFSKRRNRLPENMSFIYHEPHRFHLDNTMQNPKEKNAENIYNTRLLNKKSNYSLLSFDANQNNCHNVNRPSGYFSKFPSLSPKIFAKTLAGLLLSGVLCMISTATTFITGIIINDKSQHNTTDARNLVISRRGIAACENCFIYVWCASLIHLLAYPSFILINKCFNKRGQQPNFFELLKNPLEIFGSKSNRLFEANNKFKVLGMFSMKILGLTVLWNLTLYTYIRALGAIHVSSVIIIFSTSFAFDYMASWIILKEQFIPTKLIAINLSIYSIVFMFYSDEFIFDARLFGNVLASSSATLSSIFKILVKMFLSKKAGVHRTVLFSLIGFFNLIFCWPFAWLLHLVNLDMLSFRFSEIEWGFLLGAYALLFAYITGLQYGNLITYSIFVHLSGFLTIPTAIMIDCKLNNVIFNELKVLASICIVIGYLLLMIPNEIFWSIKNFYFPRSIAKMESSSLTRKYRLNT